MHKCCPYLKAIYIYVKRNEKCEEKKCKKDFVQKKFVLGWGSTHILYPLEGLVLKITTDGKFYKDISNLTNLERDALTRQIFFGTDLETSYLHFLLGAVILY